MVLRICDRCGGKLAPLLDISNVKFPLIEIELKKNLNHSAKIDLCNECAKNFVDWLEMGKEHKYD